MYAHAAGASVFSGNEYQGGISACSGSSGSGADLVLGEIYGRGQGAWTCGKVCQQTDPASK